MAAANDIDHQAITVIARNVTLNNQSNALSSWLCVLAAPQPIIHSIVATKEMIAIDSNMLVLGFVKD